MTTLIATISMLAAVIGIAGIVPQLITMLKARSSAGQSTVGWSLGIATNTSLAFVNLLGYHALVLGSGNLASLTGCLTAVYLVRRYRRPADARGRDRHAHPGVRGPARRGADRAPPAHRRARARTRLSTGGVG